MPIPLLAALTAAATLSLWADPHTEQIKEECAAYAAQESVPAEELDVYMKECMAGLAAQYREDAVGSGYHEPEPEPEQSDNRARD